MGGGRQRTAGALSVRTPPCESLQRPIPLEPCHSTMLVGRVRTPQGGAPFTGQAQRLGTPSLPLCALARLLKRPQRARLQSPSAGTHRPLPPPPAHARSLGSFPPLPVPLPCCGRPPSAPNHPLQPLPPRLPIQDAGAGRASTGCDGSSDGGGGGAARRGGFCRVGPTRLPVERRVQRVGELLRGDARVAPPPRLTKGPPAPPRLRPPTQPPPSHPPPCHGSRVAALWDPLGEGGVVE